MMKKVARNALCPCGSGKKYKNCCLGKEPASPKRRAGIVIAVVLAIAAGVGVGYSTDWTNGMYVGVGTLLIGGLVLMFSNPPPPSQGGDPGAINFGG